MKYLLSLAPAIIGAGVVVQAGLNRQIAGQWGLSAAVLLNGVILAVGALIIFGVAWRYPDFLPAEFAPSFATNFSPWWVILPGIIGLTLVLGGPWCIARWGAVHTFTVIISAQILASLVWDIKVENIPVSRERLIGVVITWVGVLLTVRSSAGK
jgi:uncharacterized membrane protein YdcZ (DUF606 family)